MLLFFLFFFFYRNTNCTCYVFDCQTKRQLNSCAPGKNKVVLSPYCTKQTRSLIFIGNLQKEQTPKQNKTNEFLVHENYSSSTHPVSVSMITISGRHNDYDTQTQQQDRGGFAQGYICKYEIEHFHLHFIMPHAS